MISIRIFTGMRRIFNRRRASILCVLSLGAAPLLAGCGGESRIAGREPIDNVARVETNVQALRAWVVNEGKADALVHIDIADDINIFHESIRESMKNAADHLERGNVEVLDRIASYIEGRGIVNLGFDAGLFKRVIWVVPAQVSVGELPLANYKNFLRTRRGFPESELADLVSAGKYITGTLVGIPITITMLDDLDAGEDEVILDIDLAYFLGLKQLDPLYRTGTRSTLQFIRDLREKNLRTRLVTINLATVTGDNPMDIRYFGDIIVEGLRDPEKLEPPVFEKWTMMMEAEDSLVTGKYHAAETLYERLTGAYPNDSGIAFTLGVARGFKGDGPGSRDALLNAYRLDSAYLKAFFQLANILAVQDKVEAGVALLDTPDLGRIMSDVELNFQKGSFYLNAKRPYDALTYLKKVAQVRPDDFALQTFIYQAYVQAGDAPQMTLTLEKLRKMDESRVRRDLPWVYKELGKLYEEATLYKNAMEMYAIYIVAAPNDTINPILQRKVNEWRALYGESGSE